MEKTAKQYVVANINDVAFYPGGKAPETHAENLVAERRGWWTKHRIAFIVAVIVAGLLIANLVVELT